MDSLQKYGSDSSSSADDSESEDTPVKTKKELQQDENSTLHLKPTAFNSTNSVASQIAIKAAPHVAVNEKMDLRRHIDPNAKEISYNPKYDELFAPTAGPAHPFKTQQEAAKSRVNSSQQPTQA